MSLAAPAAAEEVARCVQDAIAACEIPAPTGREERRAAWMAERLREAGLRAELDREGSVIARAGAGEGDGTAAPFVVAAHLDTVFADVEEVRVRREGDVLHAPGIGDNALGLAGLLFLARRAGKAHAGAPALVLAATVGEEGLGNLRGARAVVEDLRPAELVALEGGGAGNLITRGVGSARVALTVTAPGGHSWQDRGRPSALHVLLALLAPVIAEPGTASVNVGELHGGAGINVLAPEARATLEVRDLDTARLDAAMERLNAAARDVSTTASGGVLVELDELGRRPGGAVADDHPLVRDAVAALEEAGAGPPRLIASSTDANAALGAGIPAVTVGLAESAAAHTLEERVDVSSLSAGLTALARLTARRTGA
jgi:acetylornithine deacetylase/succinyl-diaminopimelate desuccinylase-like protein